MALMCARRLGRSTSSAIKAKGWTPLWLWRRNHADDCFCRPERQLNRRTELTRNRHRRLPIVSRTFAIFR